MTVPTLPKAAEARILRALEAAASDPAADDAPDEALAKAAGDAGVPHGHLPLLVRAYNNSRSIVQREHGADVFEKAAEFPVATVEGMAARLFPESPAPPAAVKRASAEDEPAALWYRRRADREADAGLAKAARAYAASRPAPTAPVDPRRALRLAREAEERAELRRGEAAGPILRSAEAFRALTDRLRRADAPALVDFKAAAAGLGPVEAGLVDAVGEARPDLLRRPSREPLLRRGDHRECFGLLEKSARAVVEAARASVAAGRASGAELAKAAEILAPLAGPEEEEDDPLAVPPPTFAPPAPTPPIPSAEPAFPEPPDAKLASMFSPVKQLVDQLGASDDADVRRESARRTADMLGELEDPAHEEELRSLDTQYMLQRLMLRDPVIAGHDARDIAGAFNELSDAAPGLASKPLLMRPRLRQALEMGPLDSFDGSQAVDTDQKLHQIAKLRSDMGYTPRGGTGDGSL